MKQRKKTPKSKIVIGLTGGIASGKKIVARILKELGAYIINADEVYTDLIRKGKSLHKRLVKCFGQRILDNHQDIDRSKLAKIVFNSQKALKKLNQLTHPEIIRQIQIKVKNTKKKVIVIVAPLLIESGRLDLVDYVWVVWLNKSEQINRLTKRSNISRKEANLRINAQFSLKKKLSFADVVIDNTGSVKETKAQVIKIWKQMQG